MSCEYWAMLTGKRSCQGTLYRTFRMRGRWRENSGRGRAPLHERTHAIWTFSRGAVFVRPYRLCMACNAWHLPGFPTGMDLRSGKRVRSDWPSDSSPLAARLALSRPLVCPRERTQARTHARTHSRMSLTRRAVNLAPTVSQLATGVPAARALNLAAPGKPAEHGHGHGHGLAAGRGDKVPRWAATHSVGLAGVTVNSKVNGEAHPPARPPSFPSATLIISYRLAAPRADRSGPPCWLDDEQSIPPRWRALRTCTSQQTSTQRNRLGTDWR